MVFTRKNDRDRHQERIHGIERQTLQCFFCSETFSDFARHRQHSLEHTPDTLFTLKEDFFKRVVSTYAHTPTRVRQDVRELMYDLRRDVKSVLKFELQRLSCMKAVIVFHLQFEKDLPNTEGDTELLEHCTRMSYREVNQPSEIQPLIRDSVSYANQRILDYCEHGSGWTLKAVQRIDIRTVRCPPLTGTCNLLRVSKVKDVHLLKPTIGVSQLDCFQRCVALFFVRDEDPVRLKQFISTYFDYASEGAMAVSKIAKFEEHNSRLDVKFNVLFHDGSEVFPIYRSNREAKHTINLLLFRSTLKGEIIGHYMWIENLDKFLRNEYRGANGNLSYQRGHRCTNCLSFFYNKKTLKAHISTCNNFQPQRVKVPEDGEVLEFEREQKCLMLPVIVFFDFESVNHKSPTCTLCKSDECTHKKTVELTQQVPICYSAIAVSREREVIWQVSHSGYDSAQHFVDTLLQMEEQFILHIKQNQDMIWTQQDAADFGRALICHICRQPLLADKVRDHDHLSGKFLGAAHNVCNLNRQELCRIPVYCHNFIGYDGHFITRALPKKGKKIWRLKALATNGEKLKSISLNNFQFVDTLDFLQGSLSDLVCSLPDTHCFSLLDKSALYTAQDTELKSLLLKKGVYCYEWATGLEKLKQTQALPPKSEFSSQLTNSEVTDDDYERAQRVFSLLHCKDMLEYTMNYCLLDVHLLAEVFCRFRDEIRKETELDCW